MAARSENNKRIAKNTTFLYARMILILVIRLYTSRVVLDLLGVIDYSIYNLVAGVVVMFSFLNAAMSSASQRFFNIALGEKNKIKLADFFINSINVHLIISIVTSIVSEGVGLYLIYYKLNIPPERFEAALFTFHVAIISNVFTIVRTPFNAIVIAYEKMSFYALLSVIEVVLNLLIVYSLSFVNLDKLELYSILMLLVVICIYIINVQYCRIAFPETRYKFKYSCSIIREILLFSAWSTLSSFANIVTRQSFNIILNIFIGTTINAATAIMTQVSSAIYSFIQNFQIAVNPQLIKSYACGDWIYLKKLFYSSSKISYYLMLLLSLPAVLCMKEILGVWLIEVPEHTISFCQLSILALLVNTLGGPIWTTIQASGNIKKYQTIISISTLLNIPIAFVLLKNGFIPESILLLPFLTNLLIVISGIRIVVNIFSGTIIEYMRIVVWPIMKVNSFSITILVAISFVLKENLSELIYIVIMCILSIMAVILTVYQCGLDSNEKRIVQKRVSLIINRK